MHLVFLVPAVLAAGEIRWLDDYAEATALAKAQGKLLFISFEAELPKSLPALVKSDTLDDYVFCRLRRDAKIGQDGRKTLLLDHKAFAPMEKRRGYAIVDYRNRGPNFQRVVSVLPSEYVTTATRVAEMLTLPAGSLTQRTLIWSMRVHPENPRSADGQPSVELMRHAARHSCAQADCGRQYHNPPASASSEIVAESWPWNRCVVAAALDVVDSWRQSSGHWRQASRRHKWYGYDMRSNGRKWFATGVFSD
jgi:hypothetical protein